jgi:hypothetical protein
MSKPLSAMQPSVHGVLARIFAASTATAIAAAPSTEAGATTSCRCQAVILCGADSCEPAHDDYCTNASIGFSTGAPEINFCIGEDCMSGPATLSRPRDEEIWMHGNFRHTAAPDQNPTSVTLLFDRTTGIGVIQASDEQGVDQVSLICDVGDEE